MGITVGHAAVEQSGPGSTTLGGVSSATGTTDAHPARLCGRAYDTQGSTGPRI